MKAVWLSSTYYLDPAISNLPHGDSERLFTRAIAYCGNAETRGFVPKSALKTFGIRAVSKRVSDLIAAGIWYETDVDTDGNSIPGYQFKAWSKWNQKGDDLLKRQKSDRERQQKRRQRLSENPETVSRDKSRDVTPPEQSREEKNTTYVPTSVPVTNARDDEPPRGADVDTVIDKPGRRVEFDGWKLIKPHCANFPQATRTALATEAAAMLKQGIDPDDITAGLERWLTKDLGPHQLPHLVTDIIRARTRPVASVTSVDSGRLAPSDRKAAETHAVFNELRRRAAAATQPPLVQIIDADPDQEWTATA